jgi:hypothetical protein
VRPAELAANTPSACLATRRGQSPAQGYSDLRQFPQQVVVMSITGHTLCFAPKGENLGMEPFLKGVPFGAMIYFVFLASTCGVGSL